jgi:hypothetical protein
MRDEVLQQDKKMKLQLHIDWLYVTPDIGSRSGASGASCGKSSIISAD